MNKTIALFALFVSASVYGQTPSQQLHPVTQPRPTVEEIKKSLVGKKVPALDNFDPGKAPYSLVSFMSSRCPHCAVEAPKLAELERSVSGESPTIGILRAQTVELIRRNKFEDAMAVLADLQRAVKEIESRPRKVGNLQIVPVFQRQDGGVSAFLDSASWLTTPATFGNLAPEFTITGTPTTVLADHEGVVKQVWVGEMQAKDYAALRQFGKKPDLSLLGL